MTKKVGEASEEVTKKRPNLKISDQSPFADLLLWHYGEGRNRKMKVQKDGASTGTKPEEATHPRQVLRGRVRKTNVMLANVINSML